MAKNGWDCPNHFPPLTSPLINSSLYFILIRIILSEASIYKNVYYFFLPTLTSTICTQMGGVADKREDWVYAVLVESIFTVSNRLVCRHMSRFFNVYMFSLKIDYKYVFLKSQTFVIDIGDYSWYWIFSRLFDLIRNHCRRHAIPHQSTSTSTFIYRRKWRAYLLL